MPPLRLTSKGKDPCYRAHDTYSRGAPTIARRRRVGLDYSSGRRLQQRAWRAHALVQGDSESATRACCALRRGYTGWLDALASRHLRRGRYDAQLISGQAASTARRPCSIECASIAEEQLKHYEILPVRPTTTDGEICAAHLALGLTTHTVTPSHVCLVLERHSGWVGLGRPRLPSIPPLPGRGHSLSCRTAGALYRAPLSTTCSIPVQAGRTVNSRQSGPEQLRRAEPPLRPTARTQQRGLTAIIRAGRRRGAADLR